MCFAIRRRVRVLDFVRPWHVYDPQVLAGARRVPFFARNHPAYRNMEKRLSRSASTYDGRGPGFRSSSIAACSQSVNASSAPQKPAKAKDQYCRMCGTQMELAIPKGEAAWRHVCGSCGYIDYFNPKMVRMQKRTCCVDHCQPCLLLNAHPRQLHPPQFVTGMLQKLCELTILNDAL